MSFRDPMAGRRSATNTLVAVAIIVIVLIVAWWLLTQRGGSATSSPSPSAVPTVESAAPSGGSNAVGTQAPTASPLVSASPS